MRIRMKMSVAGVGQAGQVVDLVDARENLGRAMLTTGRAELVHDDEPAEPAESSTSGESPKVAMPGPDDLKQAWVDFAEANGIDSSGTKEDVISRVSAWAEEANG